MNAVAYAFMNFVISYCGKPNEKATAYYVKKVEETVRYLQNYGDLQLQNYSFDRLFSYTSISLVQWLLSLTTLHLWEIEGICLLKSKALQRENGFLVNAFGSRRKIS